MRQFSEKTPTEEKVYIKELELQIEHQQNVIEQYERRLIYLKNALEEANRKLKEGNVSKPKKKRGRPALSMEQKRQVRELVQHGMSYRKVHEQTGISLGMISAIMKDKEMGVVKQYDYMWKDELCTSIYVDFEKKTVRIQNFTDDLLHRAFGVIENPNWQEFLEFMESRCFPRTRMQVEKVLEDMGLNFYDPLLIIEKTQGRMSDDYLWIKTIGE